MLNNDIKITLCKMWRNWNNHTLLENVKWYSQPENYLEILNEITNSDEKWQSKDLQKFLFIKLTRILPKIIYSYMYKTGN